MQSDSHKTENDWFDLPASRRLLWRLLYIASGVTLALEIVLIVLHKRHSHFGEGSPDGWWFFYPLLGFVACSLMILAAKGLGTFLKRGEAYYPEPDEPTLPEDIDDSLR